MLSLTAKDIMTRDPITIRKGATVEEALRLMAEHRVSGLPVTDVAGCLEGIITESDLLLKGQAVPPRYRSKVSGVFAPKPDGLEEAHRKAQANTVEEAMTRRVLVFSEDSLVVDIARALMEQAVNRVPIVRDCKVVGIVSRMDIVRAMAKAANGYDYDSEGDTRAGRVIEL